MDKTESTVEIETVVFRHSIDQYFKNSIKALGNPGVDIIKRDILIDNIRGAVEVVRMFNQSLGRVVGSIEAPEPPLF
ncbi:hypothetical protein HRM2_48060 [Desulforapulum autotrophicum HRM2]|uniref:Uncharacterized protein n=1 Tax=Desulforapulum autotrophicum (strain ATCC 43914 / DSM 3382 / VKM B-1955 / HRM2) TaxID=177437 RepID=C0QHJ6_DESAH|nr:hypothetical protein [Desulforapulum autotrophicum]ACN17855.1 hypothetical protein HRM2_48060 [Desulforapulum autotrophicum HRM2]